MFIFGNPIIYMTHLHTPLVFLFCILVLSSPAQIAAPVFECIRGDTLFWMPAVNNCGPFVSNDIYYSASPAGPYSLLASITDPGQTSFHHPVNGPAYYYLEANHDCPGLTRQPSDTLNTLPPAATILEKVTVQDDGVMVTWYDNMDPKTVGYIVYRSTAQGTLPIDTVFGALQYLDQTASADTRSESYFVLAMDQCGNTGLFDLFHHTIHLTTEINFCDQYVELNWNNYQNWQNGIENVQIWLGVDGNPLAFEHQVQPTDTLAFITGIDDDRQYCVAIVSKEMGRNVRSFSNKRCFTSDVINTLDELMLRHVYVNSSGEVVLDWYFDNNADLSTLLINRSEGGGPSSTVVDLSNEVLPSNHLQTTDQTALTSQTAYVYQLEAVDSCGTQTLSGTISTVLLQAGAGIPGENQLQWSAFQSTHRILTGYEICRFDSDGSETLITSLPAGMLTFTDVLPNPEAGAICYVVKAIHTSNLGNDTLKSTSNRACIEQQIGLFIPNAFVPGGANPVFLPQFALAGNISNYRMQIFNRWGGKVFESDQPDFGWDGMTDGNLLDTGVYFYLISFDQPDGKFEKRTGTVTLIR